jgi:hypothetical protein
VSHAWIEPGCNGGDADAAAEAPPPEDAAATLAASKDVAVLDALQAKLDAALSTLNALEPLPDTAGRRDWCEEESTWSNKLSDAQSEQQQLAALAAQAAALATTDDGGSGSGSGGTPSLLCMECCAGRGRLSAALQTELGEGGESKEKGLGAGTSAGAGAGRALHHVLIDRCVTKNSDQRLRQEAEQRGGSLQRLTVDLADVCLERVPALADREVGAEATVGHEPRPLISVLLHGKHLCGEAADLSLRAASRLRRSRCSVAEGASRVRDVRVAFALCCHHLCRWESIFGRRHLEAHGISREDVAVMRRLARWLGWFGSRMVCLRMVFAPTRAVGLKSGDV